MSVQAIIHFKHGFIAQLKQDTIAQHPALKQAFIEECRLLKQSFIARYRLLRGNMRFKQNFIERGQSLRESVQVTAWIDIGDGGPLRDCTVLIAEDGARIRVASQAELPDEFYLVLSKDGTRRRCRSVWRSDDEVGMSYLGPLESRNEQGHEPPPNRNPVVAFSLRSLPGAGFDGEETNSRQTPFSFFPRQPLSSHGI